MTARLQSAFDPSDPGFIADPYPRLNALREAGAVHHDERLDRWLVTRHADVRACLRDRRLGRNFRHVGTEAEFKAEPLDPQWQAFWDVERWSLLFVEPPEHTRIRKLVAAAFTPRAVEAMREPAHALARELLDECLERGRFDLLYDFAQPYSITLDLPAARRAHRPPPRPARLVAPAREDVRVRHDAGAGRLGDGGGRRVPRLRGRAGRGAPPLAARRPRHGARRGRGRRRPALRRRDRLDRRRAAERRPRGDGEHARQRRPRAAAPSRTSGAGSSRARSRPRPRSRSCSAGIRRSSSSSAGCSRTASRSRASRSRAARSSRCSSARRTATRASSTTPTASTSPAPNAAEHIGFGGGIHVCIGAPLARIELEAALRTLVERAPGLELVAEPERVPAFVIRGFQAVEVAVR